MKKLSLTNDDWLGHVDHERHACRGILTRDGSILLSYLEKTGIYMLPGGGMEEGETQAQCCEREMLEETGLVVKGAEKVLEIEEFFENWRHVNHYFICELVSDTSEVHLTEEEKKTGTTFRWLPIADAIHEFGRYEDYHGVNISNYGLYRREHLALREIFKDLQE